jgi:hypothetical protein
MNKGALLGKIIFLIVVVLLISSIFLYYKLAKNNFEIRTKTGGVILNFDVNVSKAPPAEQEGEISIVDQMTRGHKFVPNDAKINETTNKAG